MGNLFVWLLGARERSATATVFRSLGGARGCRREAVAVAVGVTVAVAVSVAVAQLGSLSASRDPGVAFYLK